MPVLQLSPLLVYQALILAVLLVLLALVVINMIVLPGIEKYGPGAEQPRVCILVPARNEEANVEPCLRGLLSQDYGNYHVWLYEDDSTDRTGEIAARLAREYEGRLHVVAGDGDPPPGWLGKANACHRLYNEMRRHSNPDYVLFTDADVRHSPGMLGHALAAARANNAGLLSIFPRQVTESWAERLAVPLMQCWAVYGILPLPLAFTLRTGPAFAAANGQFMLFTREAYEACGGHASVRDNVLEDVGLSRAVKRAGYLAILADGGPLVLTRMYNGPAEVWKGYSKNVYAFFGYSPLFLLLGVLVMAALYVLPVLFAFYALAAGQFNLELFYLPLAQYAVAVLTRMVLSARFAYSLPMTLLHPAAIAYLIAICANSMLWARTGRGGWKGRGHIVKRET